MAHHLCLISCAFVSSFVCVAQEVEKCVDGKRLHHMYPPTTERSDAEIFNDLLAGADQAYADVDAVLESNGLAYIETTHSDARMRSDGAKGMCLEMFANKVLPFDMHSTGTAAWHHFVFAKQRTPSRFYNYNFPKVKRDSSCFLGDHSLFGCLLCVCCRMRIPPKTPLWRTSPWDSTRTVRVCT